MPPEEMMYDVVSGVSAGSLNAGFISTFEKGNEKIMMDWMVKFYDNLTTDMIWKEWP